MPKTALVTGASGFIGSHICRRLMALGWDVTAVCAKNESEPESSRALVADLDRIPWPDLPAIDVCFHQAANNDTTLNDLMEMMDSNVAKPTRMFDQLANRGCRSFVYASSCSVYGNGSTPFVESQSPLPLNHYARSKLIFETFAKKFGQQRGVSTVGLRYTNVYGPGENHKGRRASMIYQMAKKASQGNSVELFEDGSQMRDWVFVDDVVEANIRACRIEGSTVVNVGSGERVSFVRLVDIISESLGVSIHPKMIPCPFSSKYQSHTEINLDKSRTLIGYNPIWNTVNGIKEMIRRLDLS
jgi:ADP-L-glycero-D-manno-heptose 6-epimerase